MASSKREAPETNMQAINTLIYSLASNIYNHNKKQKPRITSSVALYSIAILCCCFNFSSCYGEQQEHQVSGHITTSQATSLSKQLELIDNLELTKLEATTTTTTFASPASGDERIENSLENNKQIRHKNKTLTNNEQVQPDHEHNVVDNTKDDEYRSTASVDIVDEDCEYISNNESPGGATLTNNQRFLALQSCLQASIESKLKLAQRDSLELFEQLSLTGACSASLLKLMSGLASLKSYAFKFMDASAKIPSGVMYGLLSDFGDFDQCLSIKSAPNLDIELEAEEGEFSGKYCLISTRLNYSVELEANKTHLEGVIVDGLLWDDLIRNYWTSKSPKAFQMGLCVPSRCDHDDLEQLLALFGKRFNSITKLLSCQDGHDLKRQHQADWIQSTILLAMLTIFLLTILGTLIDRSICQRNMSSSNSNSNTNCFSNLTPSSSCSFTSCKQKYDDHQLINIASSKPTFKTSEILDKSLAMTMSSAFSSDPMSANSDLQYEQQHQQQHSLRHLLIDLLVCFSIRRNWRIFIRKHNNCDETDSMMQSTCSDHTSTCRPSPSSLLKHQHSSDSANVYLAKASQLFPNGEADNVSGQVTNNCTFLSLSKSQPDLSGTCLQQNQVISSYNPSGRSSNSSASLLDMSKNIENRKLNFKLNLPEGVANSSNSNSKHYDGVGGHGKQLRPNNNSNHNYSTTTTPVQYELTVRIQADDEFWVPKAKVSLSHLSGLRLLVIVWITMGMSFLYPSAYNYQYYRSIINLNITRDSVWFTSTNYTLGIDMLLYMTGLVFVYKLSQMQAMQHLLEPGSQACFTSSSASASQATKINNFGVLSLISKKILRFWPTYVTLICLAIIAPLLSSGPMWPEMVGHRLGDACRQRWWWNLLFVNNFLAEQDICLPSSWFVSVLMQLFVIASLLVLAMHKYSLRFALCILFALLASSIGASFWFAYTLNLPAPVIRMDESFVMSIDENIFRLYTNIFNNLGPFLVGMLGGLLLVRYTRLNPNLNPNPNTDTNTNREAAAGADPDADRERERQESNGQTNSKQSKVSANGNSSCTIIAQNIESQSRSHCNVSSIEKDKQEIDRVEVDEDIIVKASSGAAGAGAAGTGAAGASSWTNSRSKMAAIKRSTTLGPDRIKSIWFSKLALWPFVLCLAILVLSSALYSSYTRFSSALYWSLHRICWAIATGYLIHKCATYEWRLLHDILSLSSLIPVSRLIFITYLVFPAYIQIHSGLVRDGLHVTIYNMLNIYTTRLVFAFITALFIHLLVELPFCSIEELLLNRWLRRHISSKRASNFATKSSSVSNFSNDTFHPLLAVAPVVQTPTTPMVHAHQQILFANNVKTIN